MKKICYLFLLALMAMLSSGAVTAPHQLTVSTPAYVPNVFYLAPRTDGGSGNGTLNDPIDASTPEKLKAAWVSLLYSKPLGKHTKLIFTPGVYWSSNELQLPVQAKNITVLGYGATINFTNQAMSGQATMFANAWNGNDNIIWEGMELDCGTYVTYTNSGKVCGFFVKGQNNVLRNVTVRNTSVANFVDLINETFSIIFESTNGICSQNLVEGLISQTPLGGATAILIQGEGNSVIGNVVDFKDNPTNGVFSFAYTIYGSENTLTGNSSHGVDTALSMDGSGSGDGREWRDNIIVGNQFIATSLTLRIDNNTQRYRDWTFVGNNFKTKSMWVSLYTYGEIWRTNRITGFNFIGNRFTGPARPYNNMALGNFINHTFLANEFATNVHLFLGTNANTIYSHGNSINGVPSETILK